MRTPARSSRARAAAAVLAATAVLGTGCAGAVEQPAREHRAPVVAPVAVAAGAAEQAADPVRVRIPAIGVDAGFAPLEADAQGVLPPPATNEEVGWWRDGPEPGEAGPAVVVGHVDSRSGPAVFYRLRQLVAGDEITVERADGSTVVFAVQRSERHAKDDFPTQAVYGSTPDAQLRLITCGGAFDRSTRHYVDNVVVYAAHLARP